MTRFPQIATDFSFILRRFGYPDKRERRGKEQPSALDAMETVAGIDACGFSGGSLRAGFATSAAQAGVSTLKIRAQTGHASDAMLARYVRDGELFVGNGAAVLL